MNYFLVIVLCLAATMSQAKKITFSKSLLPPTDTIEFKTNCRDQGINAVKEQQYVAKPESMFSMLSYERVNRLINLAAIAYASYKIYLRYEQMGKPVPETAMYKIINYFKPLQLQSITNKGSFFIDAGAIIIETLLYKTLIQLLVLCGTSDVLELVESGIFRGKKIVKMLLI